MAGRLFISAITPIDEPLIARAHQALGQYCRQVEAPFAHADTLIEIAFAGEEDLPRIPVSYVGAAPVDVNFCFDDQPRPKLFVADMDSTMIGQECIDELADYAGVKAEISRVTEAAMRGELDFEEALRERVALLDGLSEDALEKCYVERIVPNLGAKELLEGLKSEGVRTALVSGGFTFFASRIAERLGFDQFEANILEIQNDKLTGKLAGPVVDRAAKASVLRAVADEMGLSLEEVIAIGDGSNDLDMLDAAGYKVAYKAKPIVDDRANIRLHHSSLEALLYITGIKARA